ncbi:MAG: hypothetical protein HC839_03170, partial [Leptolyngbyaceae cyanobacterium RM2_2_21]|nr:hypothetical protein [Leptolyngbyaceae cyanobacterium RM2_2_21]
MFQSASLIWLLQRWAVPGLMMAIAVRQIVLAQTVGLSAWHGGGFGMFASVDRDERRLIKVEAMTCDGRQIQVDVQSSSSLLSQAERTRVMTVPREDLLHSVGQKVLTAPLTPSDRPSVYLAETSESAAIASAPVCLQTVTVQVWRPH